MKPWIEARKSVKILYLKQTVLEKNRAKFLFSAPTKVVKRFSMSEENVPKLRLKPKLAATPVDAPLPPGVVPSPAVGSVPPPPAGDSKAIRLKPKLSALPSQNEAPVSSEPIPGPVELPSVIGGFPPPVGGPPPEPAPEAEPPAPKFSLRPKVAVDSPAATPPAFPPPIKVGELFASGDPIPAPDFVDPEHANEPPVAVPRSLTSRPFPPPPANFPPPPASGGARPAPPWAQAGASAAPRKRISGCWRVEWSSFWPCWAGRFFAYKKFTAVTPPPPQPAVATTPKTQAPVVPAPEVSKPEPAVVPAEATAVTTAPDQSKVATPPQPEPVEVAPPPPPASAAFKAWVDTLKVGGVRAGATTRVFIGGTAYATGEVVNSRLGIIFDSYDAETRHLVFRDKTGAKVERRN